MNTPSPAMTRPFALIVLFLAAFLWGAGNVANRLVLDHVGPLTVAAGRTGIAFLVLLPFVRHEMRAGWAWLPSTLLLSVFFAAAIALQQFSFQMTSVTNAGFLVNTCAIITPILGFLLFGDVPQGRIVAAALLTLFGAFLMTGGTFAPNALRSGDLVCLASAMFYGTWMVLLGRHLRNHGRPFATCAVQFAFTAVILGGLAQGIEAPGLDAVRAGLPMMLGLGVFSTAAAFVLQTRAQAHVSASLAAVVVSAESLFGAVGAYVWLGERTAAMGVLGAGLILFGIVVAATKAMPIRHKSRFVAF